MQNHTTHTHTHTHTILRTLSHTAHTQHTHSYTHSHTQFYTRHTHTYYHTKALQEDKATKVGNFGRISVCIFFFYFLLCVTIVLKFLLEHLYNLQKDAYQSSYSFVNCNAIKDFMFFLEGVF